MYMRKIAAAAGFATGAALAFAPFASADTPITSTVDSEIGSLNSIFDSQAALAGDSADIVHHAGSFDTIPLADAPQHAPLTTLDYELYGVNPLAAGPASDPGSYNDFNGALGKFDDAYNMFLYAAQNGGAIDMHDADFIGSQSSIDTAQGMATATAAEQYFLNFGTGDLEGYFGIFPASAASAAADPAAVTPITSTVASEVAAANSQFQLDALLAGVPSTDYSVGPQGFDIINPADITTVQGTGTTPFDYLVYGVDPAKAGLAGDPGAFNLFNGAEVRFDDAYNVALYAAENGGALDPNAADFFGSLPAGFAADTATQAFDSFWNSGVGDLSGFFQVPLTFLDIPVA